MQYSSMKTCLLALAAASTAVAQIAGYNVLTKPAYNEVLKAGVTYTIEWDPTLPAEAISLIVMKGATAQTLQLGETIAAGISSSVGKAEWAVPADADIAAWGVKLQSDANPNKFQYSNPFTVKKKAVVSSSAVASAVSSITTVRISQVSTATFTSSSIETSTIAETSTVEEAISSTTAASTTFAPIYTTIKPIISTATSTFLTSVIGHNCNCTGKAPGTAGTGTGVAPQISAPTGGVAPQFPIPTGGVAPQVPAPTGGVAPQAPAPIGGVTYPNGTIIYPNGTASGGETETEPELPKATGAAGNVVVQSATLLGAVAVSFLFL